MSVETAVLFAGGTGSRCFPATTALDKPLITIPDGKELKTVGNLVAEDCARVGVKRVVAITTPRGVQQLGDLLGPSLNPNLTEQLEHVGGEAKIAKELSRRLDLGIEFEFVVQPLGDYGTGYALHLAQQRLKGEKTFWALSGDDFLYHPDRSVSDHASALETWKASSAEHLVMGSSIHRDEAEKYGVLIAKPDGTLERIHENPKPHQVPRNQSEVTNNISQYLLSDTIWDYVAEDMARPAGQDGRPVERRIIDQINSAVASGETALIHSVESRYMDCGDGEKIGLNIAYMVGHPRYTSEAA
jgi:UTP-glucose-1-phosphate uridylyltransferase